MKPADLSVRFGLIAALVSLTGVTPSTVGQTYSPTNWVNNPFNPNPNFGVVDADSSSPVYTNNGTYLGTLYGHSPIGATINLEHPGDTVTLSGRVRFTGELNPDGSEQFRIGLYSRGASTGDTNWLGYMIGNPVNVGPDGPNGFYVRNNPNPGIYASGLSGNAMRPKVKFQSYTPGWSAGTYDFSLAVSQISDEAQRISWKLASESPGTFNYSGKFTNSFEASMPKSFDYVGFLGGAALFTAAFPTTAIQFEDVSVTLGRDGNARAMKQP